MEECNLWLRLMQRLRETCESFDSLWIKRRRTFDTEGLVKGLLHLVGGSRQSYHRVMDQLDLESGVSPAASSFCEARAKLPSFVVGEVRREVLDVWDEHSGGRLWHGYRPHAVDGTKVSLPRPLFKHGFKAPTLGYCPQGLVSLLVRLDDRMVCDIRLAKQANERSEAHEHLGHLSGKDLVIYDRGYLSFALLTAHVRQGIDAVFRVAKGTTFFPVADFWKSHDAQRVVTIDPTTATYRSARKQCPEYELVPIQLRLIKYEINGETYVLATTILDASIAPEEFVSLYSTRWRSEETFKAYKQTLELETFHSKSEDGVRQEIEAVALLWNMTRVLHSMAEPEIKKALSLPNFIALPSQLPAESPKDLTESERSLLSNREKTSTITCRSRGLLCENRSICTS